MSYLYQLGILIYTVILRLGALFNPKANLWVKGRRRWKEALRDKVDGQTHVYWFHAASLGEFEQARPLIEHFKQENPDIFVLITFFSPSGYELRKNYQYADYVCYLPTDTKRNARLFVSVVKPEKVFFIKYEFWFNYMRELGRNNIDLYLVSGIFHLKQIFFKTYGRWFCKQLNVFKHFFLQDVVSRDYLSRLGYDNSTVTGDTRFDRVIAVSESPKKLPLIQQFVDSKSCLVVGSSWQKDEELLINYINQNVDNKYIIAPHEIDESHIKQIVSQLQVPYLRWSEVKTESKIDVTTVLIIDEIGILNSIYQFANIAYVGGAFGTGLHNILEPAVYGVPVIFGPKHSKFSEARALIDSGGGFSIQNQVDLDVLLNRFFADETYRQDLGVISKEFIYQGQGAKNTIIETIKNL